MRHTAAVNNTHQDTPTAGTDDASEWPKICVLGVHFGFNCFPKCVNMVPSKRTCLDQHTAVSTDALLYLSSQFSDTSSLHCARRVSRDQQLHLWEHAANTARPPINCSAVAVSRRYAACSAVWHRG